MQVLTCSAGGGDYNVTLLHIVWIKTLLPYEIHVKEIITIFYNCHTYFEGDLKLVRVQAVVKLSNFNMDAKQGS